MQHIMAGTQNCQLQSPGRHAMRRHVLACTAALWLQLLLVQARQPVVAARAEERRVTVSGISAGGFMAHQLRITATHSMY